MIAIVLTWANEAWAATPHATSDQDFFTPLAVLVFGLVAGYVVLQRQTESDTSIDDEAREIDLGATRDEVVEALKQLEVEKAKMDPGQYEIERQQLLARGARALRELDDEAAAEEEADVPRDEPKSTDGPVAPSASGGGVGELWESLAPEWRGAITALSAVAVVGLLYLGLRSDTRERREGDPITGGDIVTQSNARPEGLEAAPPQIVAQIKALETQLKENPKDLQTLNALTQLYLSANVPGQAMEYNKQVLDIDAKDKDGRAYKGVLRMLIGMSDGAIEIFDQVLVDDPNHLLSLFYKGLVLLELERFDEAVKAFEAALAADPNNPNLARALADAKAYASGERPTRPPASGELIVKGIVDVDPAAKASLRGNEVVYASVRQSGAAAGPPVAAIKLGAQFPQAFQISTADMRAMGGGTATVPEQLDLTIRVDLDGNAMTREAAPQATVTGLSKGTDGVRVMLSTNGAPSQAAAAPAATGGDVLAEGKVTLAPGKNAGQGVLFVSIRSAAGGGPPLAAKRFANPTFPVSFRITKKDMLPMWAGRPLPGQLILKAHIDRDGNAGTQEDGPAAVAPPLAPGATGLELALE